MHSLLPLLLAQTDTAPSIGELVLKYIVAPGLAVVGPLLVAAMAKLVTYLHAKEKDSKLFGALSAATELVQTYVARAEVELRPEFAKALADGRLTPEEGKALKAKVLEILKRDMPAQLFATLSKALGPALEGWLSGKVEQAVTQQAAVESIGTASPS